MSVMPSSKTVSLIMCLRNRITEPAERTQVFQPSTKLAMGKGQRCDVERQSGL